MKNGNANTNNSNNTAGSAATNHQTAVPRPGSGIVALILLLITGTPNGCRYSLLHRVDDGSLDEDAIVNANPVLQQKLGFRPNEFVIVLPGHQQGWLLIGHVFDEQEIGAGRKGRAGNYV